MVHEMPMPTNGLFKSRLYKRNYAPVGNRLEHFREHLARLFLGNFSSFSIILAAYDCTLR